MRKWMRDRIKRRKGSGKSPEQAQEQGNRPAPLQPTFLDRDDSAMGGPKSATTEPLQPEYEAQPETEPFDGEGEEPTEQASPENEQGQRRNRSRRRGRRGKGSRGKQEQARPVLPIAPGLATGEAAEAELDGTVGEGVTPAAPPSPKSKGKAKIKGAIVLAIGLPGSGKSSWFKRHNIIPLSSDLVRGLLFDDPTEQRYQDLVFSTLRSMLRARMIAGRPWNYIDATNLSPKERHSWIKMARDFGYEAHAVFFDVPTEVCMERNRMRSRNVPDDVMIRMSQKLRPPKFEEGFAKVTIVRLKKHAPAASSEEETPGPEELE